MVLIYLVIGVLLLTTSFLDRTVVAYRNSLGFVFILYGTFRAVVAFQQYKKVEQQDEYK